MTRRWLEGTSDKGKAALRRALDEAASEPVSEVRKRRVWNRVSDPAALLAARAGSRPRVWRFGVAAALGGMAVAAGLYAGGRFDRTTIVESTPPPAPPAIEPLETIVPAGMTLETGEGERVVRTLAEGSKVDLEPRTALHIAGARRAELRRGEVRFAFATAAQNAYVVEVGRYRVVALGTRFSVRSSDEEIAVTADAGAIEIWNDGKRVTGLATGERWSRRLDTDAKPAPAASKPRRPAPALAPAAALDDELAAARAARSGRDMRRAVALYERLTSRSGLVAENALYELGSIYRDELREPKRALATWERYRKRFPDGVLRVEADVSVVDTLTSLGERDRALDEARGFLARHPSSERRAEIARVAGDLERTRGNCREAAALYAQALRSRPSSADADAAEFHRAVCLLRLEDPAGLPAMRTYLARHPNGRHADEARRLVGAPGR